MDGWMEAHERKVNAAAQRETEEHFCTGAVKDTEVVYCHAGRGGGVKRSTRNILGGWRGQGRGRK